MILRRFRLFGALRFYLPGCQFVLARCIKGYIVFNEDSMLSCRRRTLVAVKDLSSFKWLH